jgi:hypothetical protein
MNARATLFDGNVTFLAEIIGEPVAVGRAASVVLISAGRPSGHPAPNSRLQRTRTAALLCSKSFAFPRAVRAAEAQGR